MNVPELFHLTQWVEAEVRAKNIVGLYTALRDILNHNLQPNQQKQPFDAQRQALERGLNDMDMASLNTDQLDFLDRLGIGQYSGANGVSVQNEIFYESGIDLATAANRFNEIINSINRDFIASDFY